MCSIRDVTNANISQVTNSNISRPPAHPATQPLDNVTFQRLQTMEIAKARAVDNDDFDEAKRLKAAIEQLKSMAEQLAQLENQKRNAINNEDYDTAQAIKYEIDRLRGVVATPRRAQVRDLAPVRVSSHQSFSEGPQPLTELNKKPTVPEEEPMYDADERPIKPLGGAEPTIFIQVSETQCRFCGKQDESFADPDKRDIHYWKDCPMLIQCPQCTQTIEIMWLNEHLLNECEIGGMKAWARCGEAIPEDEYEMHVDDQSCIPFKPTQINNRCPLWHEDIPPLMEGWYQHILKEGCPNNDRSNF